MHGATLAVMATIAHEFAERETRKPANEFDFRLWWFIPGYLAAVALHMAFNQFPDRPLIAMLGAVIVAPLALIAIFYFGSHEAQRWLAVEVAEHRAALEALRTGRWPEGPAGERIAALAARLDAEAAQRIRRYWEPRAWLRAQAGAGGKHFCGIAGVAPLQPQRPRGGRRAQATARPPLSATPRLGQLSVLRCRCGYEAGP